EAVDMLKVGSSMIPIDLASTVSTVIDGGLTQLNIFDVVKGSGQFSLTDGTADVATGNGTLGTLTGASVFSLTLTQLNVFAGAGASFGAGPSFTLQTDG